MPKITTPSVDRRELVRVKQHLAVRVDFALIAIGTGKCFDRAAVLAPCADPIIIMPVEYGSVLQRRVGHETRDFLAE